MSNTETSYGYGCIIDAGSSGSRIYLYRWPQQNNNSQQKDGDDASTSTSTTFTQVEKEALFSNEMRPGVSTHDGGMETLSDLIQSAKSSLPPSIKIANVPIYLGATAGLRLVDDSQTIMSNIRKTLHTSGFLFQNEWARILSGDEESVYGWLVANYLKSNGSFGDDDSDNIELYGALDLGGGSTQISLSVPQTLAEKEKDDLYPLQIGNLHYPLYTQSYLYYGADQARLRFEDKLPGKSTNKVNPCYATGYTNDETGISGSSNWEECFDGVATLFEHSKNLRGNGGDADAVSLAISPPIGNTEQQRYIAMSVFVFVWDFLGLQTGDDTDDLQTLKEKAGQVCTLSHDEQTEQYDKKMESLPDGRKTNKPFAQCFNSAFAYHLLSNGYKMPVVDTPIEVYYDINGKSVEWSLGMMLVEAVSISVV